MASEWKDETRICKLSSCAMPFKPTQYRQVYHTRDCLRKNIASDFPERKCGVKHCNIIFKPRHRNHAYCSKDCLQYARNPANTAATLARQKRNRKGTYVVRDTDEQFREKMQATNPLRCQQIACMPNCRIRGMTNLGCVVNA